MKLYKIFSNQQVEENLDSLKLMMGRILANQFKDVQPKSIHEVEFRVFSQWMDDGIIQYLVNNIPIAQESFIEFGVGNYKEANTRFLLLNNNWRGLIMDYSRKYINQVKQEYIYWKYELTAKAAFITSENVNCLVQGAGFNGEIGLLHIDIDGNDYWVWKAINVVNPTIVIMEYNSIFGVDRAITIPYRASFCRTKAHSSNLYFGSSLLALCDLAEAKGYSFIGCNSSGNNAYFIRKDRMGKFKSIRPEEGYICSHFRESRDVKGNLSYSTGKKRLDLIRGMNVYNTRACKLEAL
jgi:hypothetical protein